MWSAPSCLLLVEKEVLPKVEGGFTEGSGSSGRPPDGLGVTLTFDQQKELLILRHWQLLERKEHDKELDVELERLRLDVQLREADLTQQQHELKRYRLDLIKEGKLFDPSNQLLLV